MTCYELKNRFFFEFVDSCGVLCATPVELYNAVNSIDDAEGWSLDQLQAKFDELEAALEELEDNMPSDKVRSCFFIAYLPTAAVKDVF